MDDLYKVYIPFSELLVGDCFEIHPKHLFYDDESKTIYLKKGEKSYSKLHLDEAKDYFLDDFKKHHLIVRYCPMMDDEIKWSDPGVG